MTLWKSAAETLTGLLGGSRHAAAPEESLEEIRQLMLDALGTPSTSSHIALARRIRFAQDTRALWYLRGDLMAALATLRGERVAREMMLELSQEFEGLLPGGLATRPSPLA